MKMKKRFLSILLSLMMVLRLMTGMSLTTYADGTYSGGTGTEADPYIISTVDDWKALASAVNGGKAYEGKYFRQTADLNVSGVNDLKPVGTLTKPFAGNYEGDGFAISNATINGVATDDGTVAGVFGILTGKGSISNLIVEKATVTAQGGSGWSMTFAGGLVAVMEDAAITDCSVSASRVTAGGGSSTFSGAVVGYAQSNSGEVTTISQIASKDNTVVGGGYGGVLGSFSNDGTLSMTNCYAAGSNVSAQTYSQASIGAFLGGSQGGIISLTNCFIYGCSEDVSSSSGGHSGLFSGETDNGKVTATNTYYYDTNNLPVNAESATAKTADEMKSLASTLGNAFSQGSNYPILLHPVNFEVSIEGWTYGEAAKTPSVTRNSSGTPTFTYAAKGTTEYSGTLPSNAGDYTVKATVAATSTHKAAEVTADFTIAKAAPIITVPPPNAVTYDPSKTLANVTLPTGWAWENENTVPTVGNNGYAAVYTVSDETNYDYSSVEGYSAETHKVTRTVELMVNKATAVAATVAANNRTFYGTEKLLVNVTSEATGGEMQYALGTVTEATQPYTTSIPAKTDAGTYYVWYKVKGG